MGSTNFHALFYGNIILLKKEDQMDQVMSKKELRRLLAKAAEESPPAAVGEGIEEGSVIIKGCISYPGKTQEVYDDTVPPVRKSPIFG